MASDNEVNIIVRLKDAVSSGIDTIKGSLANFTKQTDKTSESTENLNKQLTGSEKIFQKLITGGILIAIGKGILDIGKASIATAAEFEQFQVQFEVMLGSAEKATKLLGEIEKFASATPFELPQLASGAQRLLAFGVAAEDIVSKLENLGNAAGGNGQKLDTLVDAYGKLRAKGRASLEEINRFTEAGVPLLDALAKSLGVTTQEVFKLVSQGKVGFTDVDKAITNLTTGSGQFAGLIEKQSTTLNGLMSTLRDNVSLLGKDLVDELTPALKTTATWFSNLAATIRENLKESKDGQQAQLARINKINEEVSKLEDKEAVFGDRRRERINELLAERDSIIQKLKDEMSVVDETEKGKTEIERSQREQRAAIKAEFDTIDAEIEAAKTEEELLRAESKLEQFKGSEELRLQLKQEYANRETAIVAESYAKQGKFLTAYVTTALALDKTRAEGFNNWQEFMVGAARSKNKDLAAIGKAIAIFDIGVKTYQAAMGAYVSLIGIPFVGPIVAPIAATAAVAFGVEQANAVASQQPALAEGGMVNPTSGGRSVTVAEAGKAEGVIPLDDEEAATKIQTAAGGNGNLNLVLNINGKTLVSTTIENYNQAKRTGTLEVDFL